MRDDAFHAEEFDGFANFFWSADFAGMNKPVQAQRCGWSYTGRNCSRECSTHRPDTKATIDFIRIVWRLDDAHSASGPNWRTRRRSSHAQAWDSKGSAAARIAPKLASALCLRSCITPMEIVISA